MLLAFFGLSIGPSEMIVVGVVAVLLFGSRLPAVARSAGKSLSEFRRGMNDLQDEFRSAMRESDRAAQQAQAPLPKPPTAPDAEGDSTTAGSGEAPDDEADQVTAGYPEPTKPPYSD